MVVFRQKWLLFQIKWLNSSKSGCIRATRSYSDKLAVFGQKWLYSDKNGSIREKKLSSGKNGCIRAKLVVIGQKLL